MDAQILAILQAADDPINCEMPSGFRWKKKKEMARVEALQIKLEGLLNHSLELDRNVEDASFFTELGWYKPSNEGDCLYAVIAIRFSAFSNLATIWGNWSEENVPSSAIQRIIALLEEHGFTYVDAESLDEAYTGQNNSFKRYAHEATWWVRFFDYI